MTQIYEGHTFSCAKHYFPPLVYLLTWLMAELFGLNGWIGFIKEHQSYIYITTASLFAILYLLLTLHQIRKYWRMLDAKTKEGADAKRWYLFVIKAAPVTTLSVWQNQIYHKKI